MLLVGPPLATRYLDVGSGLLNSPTYLLVLAFVPCCPHLLPTCTLVWRFFFAHLSSRSLRPTWVGEYVQFNIGSVLGGRVWALPGVTQQDMSTMYIPIFSNTGFCFGYL